MANGNGYESLGGQMWKEVPTWLKLMLQVGAPTVAAGWFIYLLSTQISGDIREIRATLATHVQFSPAQDAKLDTLIRIAQTQCVNAATDHIQRRDCLSAGGK